jgi:Flp pilus assembly pilin Flp
MKNRAQSTLEYAVIIAVVAAALFAMSAYMKRSVQGKLRTNADDLSGGGVYSPRATTSISTMNRSVAESSHSYTELDSTVGGDIDQTNITESTASIQQTTRKQESILPLKQEPVR